MKRRRRIVDILLNRIQVKRLKKGLRIFKMVKKQVYCLHLKDNGSQRKIKKLEAQIRSLRKGE